MGYLSGPVADNALDRLPVQPELESAGSEGVAKAVQRAVVWQRRAADRIPHQVPHVVGLKRSPGRRRKEHDMIVRQPWIECLTEILRGGYPYALSSLFLHDRDLAAVVLPPDHRCDVTAALAGVEECLE